MDTTNDSKEILQTKKTEDTIIWQNEVKISFTLFDGGTGTTTMRFTSDKFIQNKHQTLQLAIRNCLFKADIVADVVTVLSHTSTQIDQNVIVSPIKIPILD